LVVFNLPLDGVNNDGDLEANASGTVDTIGLYGYDYSNIQLEGTFTNRKFDGSFFIKDPNIDVTFAGRIDFEEDIPSFDFYADVAKLQEVRSGWKIFPWKQATARILLSSPSGPTN
jgi:hypothetical protein